MEDLVISKITEVFSLSNQKDIENNDFGLFAISLDVATFMVTLLADYIKSVDNYLNMKCLLPDELTALNCKIKANQVKDGLNSYLEITKLRKLEKELEEDIQNG